jgi:hypothetical protein
MTRQVVRLISKGSDPVNGLELKDKRTGAHEMPVTRFDPLDA